jgi:hypothetical protein
LDHAALGEKDNMYANLELALSYEEPQIHDIMIKEQFISRHQNEPRFQKIWAKAWTPRNQEALPQ